MYIYIYIYIHLSDGDTIDLWNIRTGMPWGSTFAIVEGDLISEFRKPYEPKDFPINTHGGLLAFGAPWEAGCAERVDKKDYGICCTLVTNTDGDGGDDDDGGGGGEEIEGVEG